MYKVFFNKNTKKEFLKLDKQTQKIVASKIIDLQNGNFSNDKQLYKKYKGKFRKKQEIIE